MAGPTTDDYLRAAAHFWPELVGLQMPGNGAEVIGRNALGQTVVIHRDTIEQRIKEDGRPPKRPSPTEALAPDAPPAPAPAPDAPPQS